MTQQLAVVKEKGLDIERSELVLKGKVESFWELIPEFRSELTEVQVASHTPGLHSY